MYGYKLETEFNMSVELNIIELAESHKWHDPWLVMLGTHQASSPTTDSIGEL